MGGEESGGPGLAVAGRPAEGAAAISTTAAPWEAISATSAASSTHTSAVDHLVDSV
jgi:hypothetical protein